MGDHTDYAGGSALPMAIQLGTTIDVRRGRGRVRQRCALVDAAEAAALGGPVADAPRGGGV